jgi:hypothetical protein
MSPAYRRRVPQGEFARRLAAGGAEMAAQAKGLRDGGGRLGSRVEVVLPGDERAVLVQDAGGWRLEEPPFEAFRQDTPRAALRSFVRAAEGRRYDILVRLAPERFQAELTPEKLRAYWEGPQAEHNRTLVAALRLALDARIVEEGDEAYLFYGGGRQVRFVREDDLWRVETPE